MKNTNRAKAMGAILLTVLLVGACAPAGTEVSTETLEPTLLPTDPPMTESPVVTEPPLATDTATIESTATVGVPVTGAATVNVAEVGAFGQVLVDSAGYSLYVFADDTQNSGTSSCTGDCLVEWQPLLTGGEPVAGEGVDAALLGMITRDNGTAQVTYNGWPLYYYAGDAAPGDANGQGMGGVWFLLSPSGEIIGQ